MKYFDTIIEKGIIFLLIFTPLAFGAVQDRSVAIMELVAFVIFGAWLIKMGADNRIVMRKTPVLRILGALIALALFQILPLPPKALVWLSPSSAALYDTVFGQGAWGWRTISVDAGATREELLKLLAYSAVFLVLINHYKTKEQLQPVVTTIVYMACFLVVFALVQKFTWNGRIYWLFPVDPSLGSGIWGPYINRNHFAGYLELAMPLGLGLLLYHAAQAETVPNGPRAGRLASLLASRQMPAVARWSLVTVVLSAGVFMTLSRGGIFSYCASLVFFIGLARTRRSLRKKTGLIAMVGLVVFCAVVMASWDRIAGRFEELGQERKIIRLEVWSDALSLAKDFPVLGSGLGAFTSIFPRYQTKYPTILFEHAENDYVEFLTDMGLAGFALIAGLLYVYFRSTISAWRKRRDPFVKSIVLGGLASCSALVAHGLMDFNMRVPANALLLTVIAGMTYAAVRNVGRSG